MNIADEPQFLLSLGVQQATAKLCVSISIPSGSDLHLHLIAKR